MKFDGMDLQSKSSQLTRKQRILVKMEMYSRKSTSKLFQVDCNQTGLSQRWW